MLECPLGDGKGSTLPWASGDTRYVILADVALGECKDFGNAEPYLDKDGAPPREPEGCARPPPPLLRLRCFSDPHLPTTAGSTLSRAPRRT